MKPNVTIGLIVLNLCCTITAYAADSAECNSSTAQVSAQSFADEPLPQRIGPRFKTSGRVPHVQLGVDLKPELYMKLHRLAYQLPETEERPTIVSLPGAKGMWLTDKVPVVKPKVIVSGREFAHIHTDGSLHAPLPFERALEVAEKGWGERHPWADRYDGWDGLVMLYSAENTDQLKILIQLVTESYNYVTGQAVAVPGC